MRVLYVSKAMVVPVYRDKLHVLGREVDLHVVLPTRWGAQEVIPNGARNFTLHTLPVWFSGHNHFHLYRGIAQVLATVRPDLVHIDEEPYSAVTTQLVQACERNRVPTLFFAWQNLEKRLPPPFGAARSYVFKRVTGAIAGTTTAGDVLRKAGFRGPLAVIPQMGVDPARFAPDPEARARVRRKLGVSEHDFLIGFGGRLVPEKGLHLLVDAAAQLPAARLLILGDGPERAALEMRCSQLMAGRAHFAGSVASTEMPNWLNALDVLVLPSLTTRRWAEQFGRILIEAMCCGVPVVGARSGEIPCVVGDAGIIVDEGSVLGLADALALLGSAPQQRAELAARGRALAVERYTHDQVATETVRFYQQLAP